MKRLGAAILFGLAAATASAGLIGLNVNSVLTTQAAGGWESGNTALVGPGIEFSRDDIGTSILLTLDVADTSFTLRYINNVPDTGQGAFNLGLLSFNLTNLNSPQGAITNVALANSNFGSGLGTATFTSNSVNVPITSLIPPGGTDWSATWNITFAGAPVGNPVPEPASAGLVLAGLAAVAWRSLKQRRRFDA